MSKNVRGKIDGLLRIAFVGVLILCQIFLLFAISWWLKQELSLVFFVMEIVGSIVVLCIIGSTMNSSYKEIWIIVILVLPVMGLLLYFAWGRVSIGRQDCVRSELANQELRPFIQQNSDDFAALKEKKPEYVPIANYLEGGGFPIYHGAEKTAFYANGEEFFPAFFDYLRQAKKYIFIQFFIIANGELWQQTKEILIQKVKENVQVRVMYDDLGSLVTLPANFIKDMEAVGIEAVRFNPVNRYFHEFYLNYRNHQKIVVIDGEIGMTGGMNLSDEYANIYEKHGYWKDAFMMVQGKPVRSLLAIYLRMWDIGRHENSTDYEKYFLPEFEETDKNVDQGFFQPFSGGPIRETYNPNEDIYKQMLARAVDYCYISSPYLVLDNEFVDILIRVARSGVDVRILLPSIYDHWYTKIATCSYFARLLDNGVKIYEYKPGFVHAKLAVADNHMAMVSSINLDFRSFYLHHEAGIWMCDTPMVAEVKKDIDGIMEQSYQIDPAEWKKRPLRSKISQKIVGIFAPII